MISRIEATDLFLGPAGAPRQVVRVTLTAGSASPAVRVRVEGPTVRTPQPAGTAALAAGEQRVVEVGVLVAAPASEGSVHRVTAVVDGPAGRVTADGEVRAAATGWTMWMVSHFHYDPVWWNTQRGFTEVWQDLPDVPGADRLRPSFVRTAFDLVRAHLDAARRDPDYQFVLAELDYLKPYWDVFVADRVDLRRMVREGRIELVGGTYNEPNTNLTHPESTIRNAVYGVGYQRDVIGGDPRTAWMLDVFGHDPAFPGLMADAGLTSSAWARGPFHHVGPKRHTGDITRMQFPSEFEWISPTGRGLLTAYLANHYVAGWDIERRETLAEAMAEAYRQYRELRQVAATRNVLLPVGHDHNVPSRWCTEIHREWPRRYEWPRFRMGVPRDFFAAVRAELTGRGPAHDPAGRVVSPQTRDMNPVYPGKDVSYIDTKQAQRAVESLALDTERLATLAALLGDRYPSEALDKTWRLLAYGAHHDAVTGTESDQVYLDLLAGWQEAHTLAAAARRDAVGQLADAADTAGDGRALLVSNTMSWARDGRTRVRLRYPTRGPGEIQIRDDDGAEVPAVAEGARYHADGTLAEVDVSFVAAAVPALGYRVYRAVPIGPRVPPAEGHAGTREQRPTATPRPAAGPLRPVAGWVRQPGVTAIDNDTFAVEADPARGGALCRIVDRRTGRELLRPGGLGGELTVQEEYDAHPVWQEGPWHLLPKGPGVGFALRPAEVQVQRSPLGSRLTCVGTLGGLRVTREVVLIDGAERIDFRTHVDGSLGRDRLLRVRFDLDLPGALPVSEVGFAAVGRPFGFPDVDTEEHLWTLDNPAHTWAGLSSTARIVLHGPDGGRRAYAVGVAEVIAADDEAHRARIRGLLAALVGQGVTATRTHPDGPRYGALDVDSNLPDIRIVVGATNAFADAVLDTCAAGYRQTLADTGRVLVPAARPRAAVWVPGADLRGPRDLPVLIVAGTDLGAALDALTLDLADATIDVRQPTSSAAATDALTDYSVGLINHGTPGFVARPDGTLYLSLMRGCTGWPSGVWIDGPRRTTPDGAGFALQHWSHTFRYSLVAGPGDWRRAGFVRAGQELNHPLRTDVVAAGAGTLPARASLGSVRPERVILAALKPRGNPLAAGLCGDVDPADGVTVRLYESSGSPAQARVSLIGGLRDPEIISVLEEATTARPPVVADGEDLLVPLAATDVLTVGARPHTIGARPLSGGARSLADGARTVGTVHPRPAGTAATEPAQPIFTRYWLHNKGPAPLGNLPMGVHVHPTAVDLRPAPADGTAPAAPAIVTVTVASATVAAAGRVEFDVPAGLSVNPAGPERYELHPGDHREFDLTVGVDGAAPGRYFLAARIHDQLGQVLEDVVTVTVHGPLRPAGTPPPDRPNVEPAPADPANVEAVLEPAEVRLAPGSRTVVTLRLTNPHPCAVRGEAQLITPYGTWGGPDDELSVDAPIQGFAVPAAATGTLSFPVSAAAGARPGAAWWALARVACFGQVAYTAAVLLAVPPGPAAP